GIKVKLKYRGNLLGLSIGASLKMKVYDAFYYTDGEKCGRPAYTALSETGIDISLLDFGDNHAVRAIDDDGNSYSTVKSTAALNVNLAATLSQVFYFPTPSSDKTTLNIKLALGSGG